MQSLKNLSKVAALAAFVFPALSSADVLGDVKENLDGNKSQIQESIPDAKGSSGVYLSAGFGPAFYTGSSGWGVNASAVIPVKDGLPLYVGAEASANFWGFSSPAGIGPNVTSGATALTIAPTAIYRFEMWKSVHPYIGATIGPTFYTQDVNGTRNNRLLLVAVARPGVFTALGDGISLQAEGKVGVLGGDFYFNPHANIAFSL